MIPQRTKAGRQDITGPIMGAPGTKLKLRRCGDGYLLCEEEHIRAEEQWVPLLQGTGELGKCKE